MNLIVVATIVFALAVLMTMTGRGGGNFYVLVLVLAGFLMLLKVENRPIAEGKRFGYRHRRGQRFRYHGRERLAFTVTAASC